jgi:hypothetical protein
VNSRSTRIAAVALLVGLALLLPDSALAARFWRPWVRGAGNILQSPLDLAVSPVTAGIQAHKNLRGKRSLGQKIAGFPFGFCWYTSLGIASTSARLVGGLLELEVGDASLVIWIASHSARYTRRLLGRPVGTVADWDPGPLFNAGDLPALVSYPNEVFDVRFGLYHVSD